MRYLVAFIFFLAVSCKHKNSGQSLILKGDTLLNQQSIVGEENADSFDYQLTPFTLVKEYPEILDTTLFIRELRENCHITGIYFRWGDSVLHETINIFKKIELNGINKKYFLIEYDWHGDEPNTEFPWKKQFLFDSSGILIKIFQDLHVGLLKIFPNQNSFLLTLTSSARGNGGHKIYKVSDDTLENIYEGYYDYNTQTYDAGEDRWIYEPNELKLSVKDFNNDGNNDIAFEGKLVLIQGVTKDNIWYDYETFNGKDTISYSIDHPFKKLPLRYVFLYNSKTGHFVKSNKYSIENPFD